LKETPELTTKRFWEITEQYINEQIEDPELKGKYLVGLTAEMGANQQAVNPEAFVNNTFKTQDRAPLLALQAGAGIPTTAFPKDTALILSQLKRLQSSFKSGISVLASPQHLGNELAVSETDDGRTRLEVTDDLTNINGHR
jgi:hypothetical protein